MTSETVSVGQVLSQAAAELGREGMVTVFDSDGMYLGCMGVQTWADALKRDERLTVDTHEFVSARDASRSLGKLIDRLEAGEIAKAIILDRNRPRAIMLPWPTIWRRSVL